LRAIDLGVTISEEKLNSKIAFGGSLAVNK
jgi:hypothetical protein